MSPVEWFRKLTQDPKERVAFSSALAAVFLVTIKLTVGLLTNSLGILSEALHSGLDLIAALITWYAVVAANKPADPEHQFGHGKFENLSALVETLLLLLTCVWIIYEAIHRLIYHRGEVEVTVASFVVMVFSIIVDFSRSRALKRAAIKYNSQALEADALHFSSDILSSLVVIAGLIAAHFGLPWGDPVAALGVAALVVVISVKLGKRTLDNLLDKAPAGLVEEIKTLIESIPGVQGERVRVRQAGPYSFVNAVISLPRGIVLEQSHALAGAVKARIQDRLPGADVLIHVNPRTSPEEDLASKVRLLALHEPEIIGVHKISIHRKETGLVVDLHLEVAPDKTLAAAHHLVTLFEERIKTELGVREVNSHIEPHDVTETISIPPEKDDQRLTEQVLQVARRFPRIKNCHHISVRKIEGKLAIYVHCVLAPTETVAAAHQYISEFEQALRLAAPQLGPIILHIEPAAAEE